MEKNRAHGRDSMTDAVVFAPVGAETCQKRHRTRPTCASRDRLGPLATKIFRTFGCRTGRDLAGCGMTAVIKAENDLDKAVIEGWLEGNPDVVQVRLTKYAISIHLEMTTKKTRSSAQSRTGDLMADLEATAAKARK
jgi:hypothetical protein